MNYTIFSLFLFICISFSIDIDVVTKSFPPFVFINEAETGNERYTGFSIDYLDEIIKEIKVAGNSSITIDNYNIYHTETVGELIDEVANGNALIGIAGITINLQRENILDFSHSYFRAGLQVLAPNVEDQSRSVDIFGFLEPFSVGVWTSVILAAALAGHVMWLMERSTNPHEFRMDYRHGATDGMWWSFMALLLVGDKSIRSGPGRVFAFGWSFFGMVLIAGYTANLTTLLTIQNTDKGVSGISDLVNKNTGVVAGTSSASYVSNNLAGTNVVSYTSADLALQAAESEVVQGMVYDFPFLQYYVQTTGASKGMAVKGEVFEAEFYGIAIQSGNELKESINRAILELESNGGYDKLYDKWFVTKDLSAGDVTSATAGTFDFWDMSGIFVLLIGVGFAALIIWVVVLCMFGSGAVSAAKDGAARMQASF